MRILFICIFSIFTWGCAAPVPISDYDDRFVSPEELQVVSLAQEGMALFNASRFFEAEARFRKALFLDSSLENIKFNLSIVLDKSGFISEAKSILLDMVTKYPDNQNYLMALARVYRSEGEVGLARLSLQKAKKLSEEDHDFSATYAVARSMFDLEISQGNIEQASCLAEEALGDSAIRGVVDTKDLFNSLLLLLVASGECNKASNIFEQTSVNFMPEDSVESLFLRAQIAFCNNDLEQTIEISERASILSGLDPVKSFELAAVNLCSRYLLQDQQLFQIDSEVGTFVAVKQALKSGSLSTLYWSPALISCANSMNQEVESRYNLNIQ